jgi:hypothetical protein
MDQHETAAPAIARVRQAHHERKTHGDSRIDGVAALLEGFDARM